MNINGILNGIRSHTRLSTSVRACTGVIKLCAHRSHDSLQKEPSLLRFCPMLYIHAQALLIEGNKGRTSNPFSLLPTPDATSAPLQQHMWSLTTSHFAATDCRREQGYSRAGCRKTAAMVNTSGALNFGDGSCQGAFGGWQMALVKSTHDVLFGTRQLLAKHISLPSHLA